MISVLPESRQSTSDGVEARGESGAAVGFPPATNFVISRTFAEDLEFYLKTFSSLQSLDAEIRNVGQMTWAVCKHGDTPHQDQL